MKESTITLRVDQNTKDQLERISQLKDVKVSTIIREALAPYLMTNSKMDSENAKLKDGLHLIKTLAFSELIFWLYEKSINPEISEIREFFEQHLNLIRECKMYPIFSSELIAELEKVERELNMVLNEVGYSEKYFKFSGIDENGFDYRVLADFMYTFRYDVNIEHEIIHCK